MYIPPYHEEANFDRITAFVQAYPFATMVTNGPSHPVATHLPLLIESGKEDPWAISGHMARANTHWQTARDKENLLIFHGPHAFISTGHLGNRQSVPTWNYIAVHVAATLEVIENHAAVVNLMQRSVLKFGNADDRRDWEQLRSGTLDQLLKRVVAFRFHIRSIQARFKLSQEEPAADQTAIGKWLRQGDNDRHRELSDWMTIPRQ